MSLITRVRGNVEIMLKDNYVAIMLKDQEAAKDERFDVKQMYRCVS